MRQHGCNSWYFGAINREVAEEIMVDFIKTRYLNNNVDQVLCFDNYSTVKQNKMRELTKAKYIQNTVYHDSRYSDPVNPLAF